MFSFIVKNCVFVVIREAIDLLQFLKIFDLWRNLSIGTDPVTNSFGHSLKMRKCRQMFEKNLVLCPCFTYKFCFVTSVYFRFLNVASRFLFSYLTTILSERLRHHLKLTRERKNTSRILRWDTKKKRKKSVDKSGEFIGQGFRIVVFV